MSQVISAAHTFDPEFIKSTPPDADEAQDGVELDVESSMEDPLCDGAPSSSSDSAVLLDDPLEGLLAEAVVEAAAVEPSSGDPLTDLFTSVMAEVAETQVMKAKRKKLSTGGFDDLSPAEREKLREQIQSWEAKEEWIPKACVAVITRETCTFCGEVHESVDGLFERQTSRKPDGGERWVSWSPQFLVGEIARLPREVLVRPRTVCVCPGCRGRQGFVNTTEVGW